MKTYWAVFDNRGRIVTDFSGNPLMSSLKSNAEDDLVFFTHNKYKKLMTGATVRKVNIVEVTK